MINIVLIISLEESELIHIIPIEKKLTFHNVIILIVFIEDEKNYYYNIFLEKGLYKVSYTQYINLTFVFCKCYIIIELTFV